MNAITLQTDAGTLAVAALMVSAVFWMSLFLVKTPSILRSLFRYKIWALRDEIIDLVDGGKLPSNDAVIQLRRALESTLIHVEEVTAVKWMILPRLTGESRPIEDDEYNSIVAGMSEDEREVLNDFLRRVEDAFVVHLSIGSFAGWGILVGIIFFSLARWVVRRVGSPVAEIRKTAVGLLSPSSHIQSCFDASNRSLTSAF